MNDKKPKKKPEEHDTGHPEIGVPELSINPEKKKDDHPR